MKYKGLLLLLGLVLVLTLAAGVGIGCESSRDLPFFPTATQQYPTSTQGYPTATQQGSYCANNCLWTMVGNGVCNSACNVASCSYDGGDCAAPTATQSGYCASGCPSSWIGDQDCDWVCNNAACNYDGGDCVEYCAEYCRWSYVGDGDCDDWLGCYVAACNWDGGDCGASGATATPTSTPTATQGSQSGATQVLLTHAGFDFSANNTGEYPTYDGETVGWTPSGGQNPQYPANSGYVWWRNNHLDDVTYKDRTKDMGVVSLDSVISVPSSWDVGPDIPPLLVGHVIVAECADGYVKFKVLEIVDADNWDVLVEYVFSPTGNF